MQESAEEVVSRVLEPGESISWCGRPDVEALVDNRPGEETLARKLSQGPRRSAMNALNGLAMGQAANFAPWTSVIVLFISGVLAFALAVYLFSWDSRNTTRRGHPLLALLVFLPYLAGIFLS